jgi:WD40 repeat protein
MLHVAGDSCLSARTTYPQHACDGFRCLLMAVGKRSAWVILMDASAYSSGKCFLLFCYVASSAAYTWMAGCRGALRWIRVQAAKPHVASVLAMAASNDGALLATSGQDGTVFFFNVRRHAHVMRVTSCVTNATRSNYKPIGFVSFQNAQPAGPAAEMRGTAEENAEESAAPVRDVALCAVNATHQVGKTIECRSLHFRQDSKALLCGCDDGIVRELDLTELAAEKAASKESYEIELPVRTLGLEEVVLNHVQSASAAMLVVPEATEASEVTGKEESHLQTPQVANLTIRLERTQSCAL